MTMPFYASVDQLMRDRSELARKGISRGRSVVVLTCADGVLFVAENRSKSLRKVSEIYDQLGFAAVGRYNEFENLRRAGIRYADVQGYSYDRRDVSGRALANAYAQILGASFIEQQKPFEVELCVAAVGESPDRDQLFRITYDGSISDEPGFVVMGGTTEPVSAALKSSYEDGLDTRAALRIALEALSAQNGSSSGSSSSSSSGSDDRNLGVDALEVALLDRARRGRRAFRRISGTALAALLPEGASAQAEAGADDTGAGDEVSGAGGADA
ncbi:proteasome subunit alpha [Actinomycetospora endophytica]|uniref:Proteasome subunit alpha n=1 Tax=Actinomycetospora endophytica TaxID=2291215 RepID=A0ABS8PD86_9PSEU|nr:proteasome subunit alpha [Actinomycetospora endophytica]MCD2194964.1 proteasome subunit alpha [Actinomycetospora endophytica]